jgi:hypothetical protein
LPIAKLDTSPTACLAGRRACPPRRLAEATGPRTLSFLFIYRTWPLSRRVLWRTGPLAPMRKCCVGRLWKPLPTLA